MIRVSTPLRKAVTIARFILKEWCLITAEVYQYEHKKNLYPGREYAALKGSSHYFILGTGSLGIGVSNGWMHSADKGTSIFKC